MADGRPARRWWLRLPVHAGRPADLVRHLRTRASGRPQGDALRALFETAAAPLDGAQDAATREVAARANVQAAGTAPHGDHPAAGQAATLAHAIGRVVEALDEPGR